MWHTDSLDRVRAVCFFPFLSSPLPRFSSHLRKGSDPANDSRKNNSENESHDLEKDGIPGESECGEAERGNRERKKLK